jgi:hypothetical protein
MFIHWGLYSLIGRQEWTLEMEGIPLSQYELLARHFNPRPGAAREWAKLARKAGQKYMVMTSKHHEGFTLWPSAQSWNWNAVDVGPHRDLAGAIGQAVGRRPKVIGLSPKALEWAARADQALRGAKAKLTLDRAGYMSHPDWCVTEGRRPPIALWRPKIDTRSGLRATAQWYREAGWL